VLLTPDQFQELAAEFVNELHKVPLYDVQSKRTLASEYLRKVQTVIRNNICELPDADSNSVKAVIAFDMLVDP
jgi:hypothetical protein